VSTQSQTTDPPVFIQGGDADRLMTMILDQDRCQSCATTIDAAERWGVVAEVQKKGKAPAVIQAVRLCSVCWSRPAEAMKGLGRAWR